MMEMLERIARKLCKLEHPDMPDGWHDRAWPEWCEDASAVIAEMREPTEVMLSAAKPVPEHLIKERANVPGYEAAMRAAATADQMGIRGDWQAMIDAALATPPQT